MEKTKTRKNQNPGGGKVGGMEEMSGDKEPEVDGEVEGKQFKKENKRNDKKMGKRQKVMLKKNKTRGRV